MMLHQQSVFNMNTKPFMARIPWMEKLTAITSYDLFVMAYQLVRYGLYMCY